MLGTHQIFPMRLPIFIKKLIQLWRTQISARDSVELFRSPPQMQFLKFQKRIFWALTLENYHRSKFMIF